MASGPSGGTDTGSTGGGGGGGGNVGGGDNTGGAREAEESRSRASNSPDNKESEEAKAAAFNDTVSEQNGQAGQPGGPEFGDTTPGYSGPNPDPRGPALDDNRPDDRQDNDKPTTPDTGGLPDGDTTPNYTGPNPDPRGPALGGGDGGTNKPDEADKPEEDSGFIDDVGSFFGDLAQDIQDFARANPRVDSYGNVVGLVDADGIQRGEVASRVMSSGMSSDQLAAHLGFDSAEEMVAGQTTDFIAEKYQEDLIERAVEEHFGPLSVEQQKQIDALVDDKGQIRGLDPELLFTGLGPMAPLFSDQISQTATDIMNSISPEFIDKAMEIFQEVGASASKGAMQGFVAGNAVGSMVAYTALADGPQPGPADLVAGLGYALSVGLGTAGGAITGGGSKAIELAIEGLISYNESEAADQPQPARPADKPGKIASETGLSDKEVRERIHDAKKNMPRSGDVRNPDVVVDLDTGEIYPKNKDGTYGDSIGNIFDE